MLPYRGGLHGRSWIGSRAAQGYPRFKSLGWEALLLRRRQRAAVLVYLWLCEREEELGLDPGHLLLVSDRRIETDIQMARNAARRARQALNQAGLTLWTPGSGMTRDATKTAGRVERVVPIPPVLHVSHVP